VTRKLFSRVRHLNIQSTAIRRGSMKMSALLVRRPKRSPKNQLSSQRRVGSQKSVELLVLYRLCVTPLRARRTAAREERLSCPVLANLRMVRSLSFFYYFRFRNYCFRILFIATFDFTGNIVRIKFRSNQDSQAVLVSPKVLEQPSIQQTGSGSLLSKQDSVQHHNEVNVRSAAAHQTVQKRVITEPPAKPMQRFVSQPAVKVTQPVELSVKAPVGRSDLLPPKVLGRVEPSPSRTMGRSEPQPVKMTQRVQHPPARDLQKGSQVPSEGIQRKSLAVTKVAQKEFRSDVRVPEAPVPQKLKEPPVLKQQQEPIISVPKEEPCFSGRNVEAAPGKEAKLSRSDRKKIRKAEKKEKKFSDLFVTWNPISLEMEGSDVAEQDWLLGGTRNTDASMTCRASDCSVPFQSMEQQPSLQPRATLLPDLHIYQLPYVIPF